MYFPRFQPQGSHPVGTLTGLIRQEGRCLLIDNFNEVDNSSVEYLALWSSDFRAVDSGDGVT
ncbi:MAG: hypothetical protein M3472_05020, partial [Chloroflexota bacterium]|nr:hypothetical protein [Chloroflexota bacterium]